MNLLLKTVATATLFGLSTSFAADIVIDTPRDYQPGLIKRWIEDDKKFLNHVAMSSIDITNLSPQRIALTNIKMILKDANGTTLAESNYSEAYINKREVYRSTSGSGYSSENISTNNGMIYVDDYAAGVFPREPIEMAIGGPNLLKRPYYSTNGYLGQKESINIMELGAKGINNTQATNVTIEVSYIENGETSKASKTLNIVKAESKGKYIFPVKGEWKVYGGWHGEGDYHRHGYNEEFALDLVKVEKNQDGEYVSSKPGQDYYTDGNYSSYTFGEPLLAMADGVVVAVVNNVNDTDGVKDPAGQSGNYFAGRDAHWKPNWVYEQHGPSAFFLANIIIIKHEFNGRFEYSYYGHLKKNSARVLVGDRVSQGDTIALLGNSGNSSGPHLHFSIMTHQDPAYAMGLPMEFTNIKYANGKEIKDGYIDNSSVVKTFEKNEVN